MLTRQGRNHAPRWFYREVDLNVTSPQTTVTIQADPADDYLLQYIHAQWPAVGVADPTAFADIEFTLTFPQVNRKYINVPVPAMNFTSPGQFANFTGSTDQPNQTFFRSKRLDYPIKYQMTFQLHITNYLGAANPNTIQILFIGRNVFRSRRAA